MFGLFTLYFFFSFLFVLCKSQNQILAWKSVIDNLKKVPWQKMSIFAYQAWQTTGSAMNNSFLALSWSISFSCFRLVFFLVFFSLSLSFFFFFWLFLLTVVALSLVYACPKPYHLPSYLTTDTLFWFCFRNGLSEVWSNMARISTWSERPFCLAEKR